MKKPKKARDEQPSRDAAEDTVASASAPLTAPAEDVAPAPAAAPAAPAAVDDEDDEDAQPRFDLDDAQPLGDELDERPLPPREPVLTARLSHQLHDKLIRTARDEGVTLESLVQELLAEGVTLRAWEIIERKGAMRGIQPQGNGPQGPRDNNRNFNNNQHGGNRHQGHTGHGGHRGPGGGGNNGRMSNNNRPGRGNNAWMEDKAAFLEYVRNQEKRRR